MDWNQYIIVAEELSNGSTLGHYKSAISRAYYGAFNIVKEKLGFTFIGKDIHQRIISALRNDYQSTKRNTLGHNLGNLRDKRNNADYDQKPIYSYTQVKQEINNAKAIISLVDIILLEEEEAGKKKKK
jgi:uncharacterized protein (UPF0332 family)